MSDRDFPGAKWWKFDFHTHTPASYDYREKGVTCEAWLRKFMERGIDCVAVTDHNSGEWIDVLKQKLAELEKEHPQWYRPLHLFPGVEISANSDVHILAVFDPGKTTGDINFLLGAVGYPGTKGSSDAVTKKSLTDVINSIVEADGIAIPAHVDRKKGLFSIKEQSLKQILENPNIHAMELCDKDFKKPKLYRDTKTDWTEVRGSDFHGQETDFFTWVKMGYPSIEGLRLALIDGSASVNRNMEAEPNEHADYVIEEIEVDKTRYMGRPKALTCRFSPFLNTVIGGRGSGKSTLLEFMRLALRRTHELPKRFEKDYEDYFRAYGGGLLTEGSTVHLVYRKGDTRYSLGWDANSDAPSLREWNEGADEWQEVEGDIASLFPVSIYSQKQIFELASEPQGLLGVIDEEPEVGLAAYEKAFHACSNICKQLSQQKVWLNQKISEEKKLKGQLHDLTRQIEQVEKSGHRDALQNYRLRQQQLHEIQYVEQHWREFRDSLSEILAEVDLAPMNEDIFARHPEILTALQDKQRQWWQPVSQMREVVAKLTGDLQQWETEKQSQAWVATLNQDLQQYKQLCEQLEQQGVDPQVYPNLLQKRAAVEKELQQTKDYRQQREQLREQFLYERAEAERHRQELTERRKQFLERVLKGNKSVQISITPFAEPWADMKKTIREILQLGDRFDKDIEALEQIKGGEEGWKEVKQRILSIREGKQTARDTRFQSHLQSLPNESLIDLHLWFPEDALQITYGEQGKKIQEGSPGQKCAALLAFILAYGVEPLLLDQPEDDLDNNLIYDLIVQAIKGTKMRRQIIVVTHNANIVVNGDSEMVHCLQVWKGQSHLKSDSLQSETIRQRICETLEGGSTAFAQRYKRIHLEK